MRDDRLERGGEKGVGEVMRLGESTAGVAGGGFVSADLVRGRASGVPANEGAGLTGAVAASSGEVMDCSLCRVSRRASGG